MNKAHTELIVVGDVHGDISRLRRFFDYVKQEEVTIVMVGDYINRGPRSKDVLDLLLAEKRKRLHKLILLRGNHEQALLDFLDGGHISDFTRHGGLATIKSYISNDTTDAVSEFISSFPVEHLTLVRSTKSYYRDGEIFVSHAGFNTENPNDLDARELIYGDERIFSFTAPWPSSTTVVGHYVQQTGKPFINPSLLAIDTGCGTLADGPLTAVRLPYRDVCQF
jgi:serine/threonine protein phosphatase 1